MGRDHGYVHARCLSLQNKFVGSTLNSKSPLPVQSLKILRFIRTAVALAEPNTQNTVDSKEDKG